VITATEVLEALLCAAGLSGLGIVAYWLLAWRASRRIFIGEPN
jgi:hypothetical protein